MFVLRVWKIIYLLSDYCMTCHRRIDPVCSSFIQRELLNLLLLLLLTTQDLCQLQKSILLFCFFAVKIYVTSGCSSHKREMYFADRVSNSALNQKSMYADDTLLFLIIRKFDGKSPRPKKKRNKKDMTLYIISQVHFIYHCVPS